MKKINFLVLTVLSASMISSAFASSHGGDKKDGDTNYGKKNTINVTSGEISNKVD